MGERILRDMGEVGDGSDVKREEEELVWRLQGCLFSR